MTSVKIRPLTLLLLLATLALAIVGFLYFTKTAADLPAFFPGHLAHSTHKHVKHGMVAVTLAAVTLVGAWVSTAPTRTRD